MVLGLNRSRLRSDASGLFSVRTSPIRLVQTGDWSTERGSVLFESNADLIGGFPGYAERGALLDGVRFALTDSYLLADEGQPNGFGLPLRWIEGTAQVFYPGKSDSALRIFYRENGAARSFTIRFGASRLGSRGVSRSVRVQQLLRSTGLKDRFLAESPVEPNFTVPWEQTHEFETENAIWTGRATAPIQVGSEAIPSDVWLTTKSLIWGGGAGSGLNRIPLTLLMDMVSTRLRDRTGTPAVYIAIGDARSGRFELPFIFDLHTPPDRNFRERGAFLVGLRSRGLPAGTAASIWQPWSIDPGARGLQDDGLLPDEGDQAPASTESEDEAPALGRGLAHAGLERDRLTLLPPEPLMDTSELIALDPFAVEETAAEPVLQATATENDPATDDAWFVDVERPTVPVACAPIEPSDEITVATELITAEVREEISALIDAALSGVETEKDSTERFRTVDSLDEEASQPAEDFMLAEWSSSASTDIEGEAEDIQVAEAWPVAEVAKSVAPMVGPVADSVELDQIVHSPTAAARTDQVLPSDGWDAVRTYEAVAVGALAEALRVIDDRTAANLETLLSEAAPSSWEQARAVTGIANLVTQGAMMPADARARRERLLTLGDVSVRLRTLVELFDGGYLTAEELDAKRSKLVKSLSNALVP